MLVAYLDESYSADMFFIGAAVAEEAVWSEVSSRLADVLQHAIQSHGLDADAELHAVEIMGGKHGWSALRGKHHLAEGVMQDALATCRSAGVQYIFAGLDVARLNARFRYPRPPHEVVLRRLLEDLDHHAVLCGETEPIRIIADHVDTMDELQATFAGYQTFASPAQASGALEHIATPLVFADSRAHFGLQAADLAVYLWRRRETVTDPHPRAAAALRRLMREVDPATVQHSLWLP